MKIGFVIFLNLIIIFGNIFTHAQKQLTEPLTLRMLITGLKSDSSGMSLSSKNKYIALRVRQLGVDFRWTSSVERRLRNAGANDSLITAIRRKAPKVIDERVRAEAKQRRAKRQQDILNLTKAIKANSNDVDAYKKRGILYERQADYYLALQDYVKVLEIHPDDKTAKFRLSKVLDDFGNYFYIPVRRKNSIRKEDAFVKGFISIGKERRREMMLISPFYKGDRDKSFGKRKELVNVLAFVNPKGRVVSATAISNQFWLTRTAVQAAKRSSFFEKKSVSKQSNNDWVIIIYEYER